MTEEQRLGEWSLALNPDGTALVYETETSAPIALLQVPKEQQLAIGFLIAKAPALRDALRGCLALFRFMAEHDEDPARLAALDMIPSMEATLQSSRAGADLPYCRDTLAPRE